MIRGGIVDGYYKKGKEPVSFIYLKGRNATRNPAGSKLGRLTNQKNRTLGSSAHHPFLKKGQTYAIGSLGNSVSLLFGFSRCGI